MIVTEKYLIENPNHIFVFGDNLLRKGTGGAAILRHLPNTYGFITKKAPTYKDEDFYMPMEYIQVYHEELKKLKLEILLNPDKLYMISKIGGGLANKNKIFELIIQPNIKSILCGIDNVLFLW